MMRGSSGSAAAALTVSLNQREWAFSPWIDSTGRGEISAMAVSSGMFMNDSGLVSIQEPFELIDRGSNPRGVLQ